MNYNMEEIRNKLSSIRAVINDAKTQLDIAQTLLVHLEEITNYSETIEQQPELPIENTMLPCDECNRLSKKLFVTDSAGGQVCAPCINKKSLAQLR
jgi:formylmethanofuran dehydrogenase subunit E